MAKQLFYSTMLTLSLLVMPASVSAQQVAVPPNLVRTLDNKLVPAPGYTWVTSDPKELRVRWVPRSRHPSAPNVVASSKENNWLPAAGFRWVNDIPNDLRVVQVNLGVQAAPAAPAKGPSDEDIGKAVLKTIGAVILHNNSIPQANDNFLDAIGRGLAKTARDNLIDSALGDVFPSHTGAERGAVKNLVILALDGRMPRNRDQILAQLRQGNPEFANGAEAVEFLLRLGQELDR